MTKKKPYLVAVALGAAALLTQAGAVAALGSRPAGDTRPAVVATAPTGSIAVVDLGATSGWKVLTSATATQSGAQISTPGFSTSGWLTVANDGAGAPGTEINALL